MREIQNVHIWKIDKKYMESLVIIIVENDWKYP